MEDSDKGNSWLLRWLKAAWDDLKCFWKELSAAVLFGLILSVTIFVASRPATSIDRPWPHFQVLQRSILAIVRSTAFRSIAAPLTILAAYGGFYYVFGIRGRRFIVVANFNVWSSLEKSIPPKGVEGVLQDELMRLLTEMRASAPGLPIERARADLITTGAQTNTLAFKPELGGGYVPDTQVTVQYEGISLEGLHTFLRRYTQREVVITGECLKHPAGFLVVARTKDRGPWEVLMATADAVALRVAMQKLAIRILTSLAQDFLPREANNFVFLQFKASDLEEYDLGVRLAQLALDAAPRKYKNEGKRNLAAAHVEKGVWFSGRNEHRLAILEYERALNLFRDSRQAWNNLGLAYQEVGEEEKSNVAFKKAEALAHVEKGVWFSERNEHRSAILEYETAVKLFPDSREAWNKLGLTLHEVGEREKSKAAFKKAEALERNLVAAVIAQSEEEGTEVRD